MPERPYRLRELHDHLVRSGRISRPTTDVDQAVYGDGSGYCRECGMNEPRHTSACPTGKAFGDG